MVYELIDIRKTINVVINLMKQKNKTKKVDLICEIDPNVPIIFCTEPRRLK